jgi:CRP/FNR family transcriptional regulator, cyclic AMP receptor protein
VRAYRAGAVVVSQDERGDALYVLAEGRVVIGNLALLDVYGRLAGKLRELARAEGQETEDGFVVRERPTMTEIAATIGTSRETVSRLFAELSRRGLVIATGKRLLVRRAFLID